MFLLLLLQLLARGGQRSLIYHISGTFLDRYIVMQGETKQKTNQATYDIPTLLSLYLYCASKSIYVYSVRPQRSLYSTLL